MGRLIILFTTLLCLWCLGSVECFNFWNATEFNVEQPNLVEIDSERAVLIVGAKNSISHLSFDLENQFNVQTIGPDEGRRESCINYDFNPPDDCENYLHVLTLPQSSDTITSNNGTAYSLSDTALVCGSNAFNPECTFRHRGTLEELRDLEGSSFCPYKRRTGVASMWSSTGQLVSATPLDQVELQFAISVSSSPFNGQVAVQTLPRNQNWFYNSPAFVSMHEIGDYFYVFFQEQALESPQSVFYSRVARVCKNDAGSLDLAEGTTTNIFTTFVKARISCSSGTGNSNDIKFHYNEIQDTFYVPNGSPGSQEELYAVFTSARNGPTGSAVCVFTFGDQANDIGTVFDGDYLRQAGDGWETVSNYEPFTCESGSRSLEDARSIQLMKSTIDSSNGPHPLQVSEDYSFDKIVVTQTTALDQQNYSIVFIAAHSSDELVVIKASLSPNQEYHVIHTEVLGPSARVSQMKLSEEGNVYLATDSGVYGLTVATDCSIYKDCCSCMAARDPFCAFDSNSSSCVRVSDPNNPSLAQSLSTGSGDNCPSSCEGSTTTSEPTTVTTASNCVGVEATGSSTDTTFGPAPPSVAGLNSGNSTKLDHTWTIVGAVVGFAGGIFVGIIVTAFFFRKANIFYHAKRERRRRRRRDTEECGNERKNLSNRSGHNNLPIQLVSSNGKAEKNNNVRLNDYTPMTSRKHAADVAAKLSATYPPLCCDVPDSCSLSPVSVSPPTPPYKKTVSAFAFDTTKPPASPPHYTSLSGAQVRADPNVKSNVRTEEHISNQQRAAYGRNILARAPSVDATKHAKYSKTTLPVVSPQLRFGTQPVPPPQRFGTQPVPPPLRFGTQPVGSVEVPDAVTGWSQC